MRGIILNPIDCVDCGKVMRHPTHRIDEGPYIEDNVCESCYTDRAMVMHNANRFHQQAWWEKGYYGLQPYEHR